MLADHLGMDLEIHKSEWSSIGISMDVGDYDCIIAGMGRTAERELAYSFTTPYYYRDNCIVVKADGPYAGVKGLSDMAGSGARVTTQLGTGWIPLLDQIPDGVKTGNFETTSECPYDGIFWNACFPYAFVRSGIRPYVCNLHSDL